MRKTFNSFILIIAIFTICFVSNTVFAESTNEQLTNYQKSVEILKSFGILRESYVQINDTGVIISDGVVNEAIFNLTGIEVGDKDSYADISYGIATAKFIHALGYYKAFQLDEDATDQQYFEAGSKINLLKDVRAVATERLTSGNFVKMLENALDIKQLGAINPRGEFVSDGNFWEKKEITKRRGILESVPQTSIYEPSGCSKDIVVIDGAEYESNQDLTAYLGYDLEFYTQVSDDSTVGEVVLSVFPCKNNEVTTVDAYNISQVSYDFESFSYKKNGRNKNVRLENGFALIYNGRYRLKKETSFFNPEFGSVTLIDNDNDGRIEVVLVTDYRVYIVDYIKSGILYDQCGNDPIDIEDESIQIKITKNGAVILADMLRNKDVAYVAQSADGEYISVVASDKSIEGTLNKIDIEDDKYSYFTIDGKEYMASSFIDTEGIVGIESKFYVGPDGMIQRMEYVQKGLYGILIRAYHSELDDKRIVKIFTHEGNVKEYELAEKAYMYNPDRVKINEGQMEELSNYAKSCIEAPLDSKSMGIALPLVMYSLSNDKLKTISLPSVYNYNKTGSKRDSYTLESAAETPSMLNKQGYNLYSSNSGGFYPDVNEGMRDGNVKYINNNTIVFNIILGVDGIIHSGYYNDINITKGKTGLNNCWYWANFYNLTDDRDIAVMTLCHRATSYSECFLVDKVVQGLNADEEPAVMVSGYTNGEYRTLEFTKDCEFVNEFLSYATNKIDMTFEPKDLRKGDFLYVRYRKNNEVIQARPFVLSSIERKDLKGGHNAETIESGKELAVGEVVYVSNKVIALKLDSNAYDSKTSIFYVNGYNSVKQYFYDEDEGIVNNDNKKIMKGDYVAVLRENTKVKALYVRR